MATRAERLEELASKAFEMATSHGGEEGGLSPIDAAILVMYGRAMSLVRGVKVLLDADLPEEAVILGREIFTDSLRLAELASRDLQGRAALVLGLANSELTEWENMEREAASLDSGYQTAMTETIARRLKHIQEAMGKFGVEEFRRFAHEKQLASDLDRLDDLMDFQLAHRLVHRADMAQGFRTKRDKDRLDVYLANWDPELKASVAAFAAQSCLHAFRAAASIFGWVNPGPNDANELLEQVVSLAKEEESDG